MTYRSRVLITLLCVLSTAWAQQSASISTEFSPEPSQQARDAEGERLRAKRAELEQTYQLDVKACYQKFDVTSCRSSAREKRIAAHEALRQEELRYNAQERRIAAQEAQQRLQERQQEAQRKAQETHIAPPPTLKSTNR